MGEKSHLLIYANIVRKKPCCLVSCTALRIYVEFCACLVQVLFVYRFLSVLGSLDLGDLIEFYKLFECKGIE